MQVGTLMVLSVVLTATCAAAADDEGGIAKLQDLHKAHLLPRTCLVLPAHHTAQASLVHPNQLSKPILTQATQLHRPL